LLLVTNPVDVLTWHAWKRTGWNRHRVFGQAGVLDAARMASFMAESTGISVRDIHTMVIGGHGDAMVPLTRFSTISGLPVTHFIDGDTIEHINEKTRHGGAEVLEMRQHSSAYNAPAAAVAAMVDAIRSNRDRLLPCVCILDGEYGERDIPAGVPAILGRDGIKQVIELPLEATEQEGFRKSVESILEDLKQL
jgi:malate dehydrogenase